MKEPQSTRNLLLAAMTIVMVFWGVTEFALQTLRPDAIQREERISAQFERTTRTMWQIHAQLQLSAQDLINKLGPFVELSDLDASFYETLSADNYDGITAIYRDSTAMMWTDGFSQTLHQQFVQQHPIVVSNSVGVYLLASTSRQINSEVWHVLRSQKVFEIANPGSEFGDVYRANVPEIDRLSPTPFYLEGRPDQIPSDYRFNIITLQDNVRSGFLVLSSQSPEIRSFFHPELDMGLRAAFFVIIWVLGFLVLYLRFGVAESWLRTFSFAGMFWGFVVIGHYLGVIRFLMTHLGGSNAAVYTDSVLFWYIPVTIAVVLTTILIGLQLIQVRRYYGFTWYPRTIVISLSYGVLFGYIFVRYLNFLGELSRLPSLELVDLTLVSSGPSLWIMILVGFSGASLLLITGILGWFILNSEKEQENWVHPLVFTGFVFSFVSTYSVFFGYADGVELPYFWMMLFFGLTYFLAWKFFENREVVHFYTVTRAVLGFGLLVTIMVFPVLKSGTDYTYERSMYQIAQQAVDPDGWRSQTSYTIQSPFLTAVYSNGELTQIGGDFSAGQFPDNKRPPLESALLWAPNQYNYSIKQGPYFEYRELVMRAADNRIALVQARNQNLNNYLYSFMRLLIHLIILGAVFVWLVQLYLDGKPAKVPLRSHFQGRIQDTYILSSFVFIVLLIAASYTSIRHLNLRDVELDTAENLDLLHFGLQSGEAASSGTVTNLGFDYLQYSTDALPVTTRPELAFSLGQSGVLPYRVYHELVQKGSHRVLQWSNLDGNDLLVGYRLIADRDSIGHASVVAIPAMPGARKYLDQVLQTMSTLVLLYLVIFGLFIIAGYYISVEILRPIQDFREGLRRIADGQLDAILPVNSQDEIGELANAYNMMVYKLKDLQEELAETERQSAWTEMARQVAHEIKNPLTPMKLSIQHLYQQVEYGEKTIDEVRPLVRRIAGTLIQEIDSLSNIASDFSKFARPIVEEFKDTSLNDIIREVLDLHRHDTRVEIFFDASSGHLVVHAAVDEFKRVLINLVKNAVEAVGTSGVILIRTYDFKQRAWIEIVDNGCGMSRELLQKVFIPNFSTKNAGTGLGLAISKKIVDAHKGSISCASAPGAGSTFSISLPLVTE